jgi:sulfiredoxin
VLGRCPERRPVAPSGLPGVSFDRLPAKRNGREGLEKVRSRFGSELDFRTMMKREAFSIASVYVPTRRRSTLDPKKVQVLAESILQAGQLTPILLRRDGDRFVLVEGLHRLEACRALGEITIDGYLVDARKH